MTLDAETRKLAAIAYGEASVDNIFEEMAGLANVMLRQAKARGYSTVSAFVTHEKSFSFVVSDGNKRYARFMRAKEDDIAKDTGMSDALKAAKNAMEGGVDYSNGAYFWDGVDIKTNYSHHAKVKAGIHFTKPEHNIYKIKSTEGKYEASIITTKKTKGKIVKEKRVLGIYPWTYESTAAAGGTIFWRLGEERLKATNGKEYK